MEEIGANTKPIQSLMRALNQQMMPLPSLHFANLTPEATEFAIQTLGFLEEPLYVRAAVFFHAREDVMPSMFERMLAHLKSQEIECPYFQLYLERHIKVEAGEHGSAAEKLLSRMYDDQLYLQLEAEDVAADAVAARIKFWDKVLESIEVDRARAQRIYAA